MDDFNCVYRKMNRVYFEHILKIIQTSKYPVVLWGTTLAGQIGYTLMHKLNITVQAFGDNNTDKQGKYMFDIEIMSMQKIKERYPNAIIFCCSFLRNITELVKQQLIAQNTEFVCVEYEFIEYYYELSVLNRKIRNKDKLFEILNIYSEDKEKPWRRELNRKVIAEYRCIISNKDNQKLMDILNKVYAVKDLYLIAANGSSESEITGFIAQIADYDNIGHIILVLDGRMVLQDSMWNQLQDVCYFLSVDDNCSFDFKRDLKKHHIAHEFLKYPRELFEIQSLDDTCCITEQMIYTAVQKYVEEECDEENKIYYGNRPVYIVQIFNGLANQMMMYLFGRLLEERSGRVVVFDDTILALDVCDMEENIERIRRWRKEDKGKIKKIIKQTREKNSFYCFKRPEIAEIFDIPIRLLSDYFEEKTWNAYLKKTKKDFTNKYAQSFPLGQLLMKQGVDITLMQDSKMPREIFPVRNFYRYDTHILELPYPPKSATDYIINNEQNTYYMGIWTMGEMKDWLYTNRNWVRGVFQFPKEYNQRFLMYQKIISEVDGVMLHIRRGDFVQQNMAADALYFKKSVKTIEELAGYEKKMYFVFSDDSKWCRMHERELGLDIISDKCIFVEGNFGKNAYMDMHLMSLGKVLVPTPGSTFSYMALLLSETMESCVDAIRYKYNVYHNLTNEIDIVKVK